MIFLFINEKVDVTYIESPGVHNWAFWNEYLEPAIQWMLA
jgi:S-formylglutathione hydrolase FrmB